MTTGHVTTTATGVLDDLPAWVTLVRAPNPGPMTLDGTNTWVVRTPGARECVVIDPGPLDEGHLAAIADQAPIGVVLVTHGHPDHVLGVPRLSELVGGVPVLAAGSDRLREDLTEFGLTIRTLSTPGHTADSISFVVDCGGERAVFTGDTVLGRGTTVVAYPDGDLGQYLDSLHRLEEMGRLPVLPGHGPALVDCAAASRFYLNHRQERLEQVRRALAAGAETAQDVVAVVYADVDRSLWWAAEMSVRAQLSLLRAREQDNVAQVRACEQDNVAQVRAREQDNVAQVRAREQDNVAQLSARESEPPP